MSTLNRSNNFYHNSHTQHATQPHMLHKTGIASGAFPHQTTLPGINSHGHERLSDASKRRPSSFNEF